MPGPFQLLAVVHLVRPAGRTARTLAALRTGVAEASPAALLYHTRQPMLRHARATEPPADDFSTWVRGVLQDRETAERLSFALQAAEGDATGLRGALDAVLADAARDGGERCPPDGAFVFLDADSVLVPIGEPAADAGTLMDALTAAPASVLYLHLVELPFLAPERPALPAWLRAQGQERLAGWLAGSAREGLPVLEWRRRLVRYWRRSQLASRLAEATARTEDDRLAEGRRVLSDLMTHLRRGGGSGDGGDPA